MSPFAWHDRRRGLRVLAVSVSSATASRHEVAAKAVTISVASLIPGSTKAAIQQFNTGRRVREGEPGHQGQAGRVPVDGPDVRGEARRRDAADGVQVPFTDARTLGDNGQLADLTARGQGAAVLLEVQPGGDRRGHDAKGQVVALPKAAYAQALHYNRKLFSEAGLNPNKPPTTWAQVEADAKQISQKTGKAGYAEMGKDDNTAGWILTTLVYSLGGRMETRHRHEGEGDVNNPQAVQALNMLKKMRWTDNSMGSNFDYGWSDINQAFAAGQVGMYISGSDVYTNLVQASNINPRSTAWRRSRSRRTRTPAFSAAARWPRSGRTRTRPTRAAAVKWIDFYYEQPLINEGAGDPQRPDAGREQAAGRRARAAGLQQGAVRPCQHVDQALHQRPDCADDAVHHRHLQPEADPGAGGVDPERLPLARRGRRGGAHRPERQHPRSLLAQANSTGQAAISAGHVDSRLMLVGGGCRAGIARRPPSGTPRCRRSIRDADARTPSLRS